MIMFLIFYFTFSALVELGTINNAYATWKDIIKAILFGWIIFPIKIGILLDDYIK